MTYFNELGQARVGWRIPTTSGVDADALAFITAAAITGATQQNAIITLVTQLKTYGIWTKMKAIYPFVGGTAAQHRFNLKDPRAVDAAYYLTFYGGGTHSATGYLPNGNSYADTKLNPSIVTPLINHLSYYSRTNVSGTQVEMGIYDSTSLKIQHLRVANAYQSGNLAGSTNFTSTTDSRGFWVGARRSNSDKEVYKNGLSEGTYTTLDLTENPNKLIYIGARNENTGAANFSTKESAFASIGDGLSDTEAAAFYTAVQAYQTTLGRNV
jgi:hypothetical protein